MTAGDNDPIRSPRSVAASLPHWCPCVPVPLSKTRLCCQPSTGRRGGDGGVGGSFRTPIHPLLQSAMERAGGVGRGGVTLLALVPERGHSPKPRAHSGAEDSEVKLVMPRGLVMEGGQPCPLPTPLHPWGKATTRARPKSPCCCPGERREGELGGHHHHQCINGDIPRHGMGTPHGTAGTQASKPGGGRPPMKVTSSCTKDANATSLTHTPGHPHPIVPLWPHPRTLFVG